jgi:hypothetical protein
VENTLAIPKLSTLASNLFSNFSGISRRHSLPEVFLLLERGNDFEWSDPGEWEEKPGKRSGKRGEKGEKKFQP